MIEYLYNGDCEWPEMDYTPKHVFLSDKPLSEQQLFSDYDLCMLQRYMILTTTDLTSECSLM